MMERSTARIVDVTVTILTDVLLAMRTIASISLSENRPEIIKDRMLVLHPLVLS
jgi:hypothetical protein